MQKTLILGLGNDILCDDGIGMRLAQDLEKMVTQKLKGQTPQNPFGVRPYAPPAGARPDLMHRRGFAISDPTGAGFCVPHFSFLPASIDGLELLEVMDGYDKVFIIDAFKTNDLEIGEVVILGVEDLSHSIYIGSPHSVNLATAVKLCKDKSGLVPEYKIPKEIIIIAVNVFDTQTFSENLSPQLQEKYPDILNKVIEIITGVRP